MTKTSELIWQDTQHQILFKLIDQIKEVPFDHQISPDKFVWNEFEQLCWPEGRRAGCP